LFWYVITCNNYINSYATLFVISTTPSSCRCTLWTHKYGMLFSPPSLGAFQVPSVMLVRSVILSLSFVISLWCQSLLVPLWNGTGQLPVAKKKVFFVKQIVVGSYLLLLMQIRTLGMLRVRFKSMPDAFRKCHAATHKEVLYWQTF
jgi:hypothetical protein